MRYVTFVLVLALTACGAPEAASSTPRVVLFALDASLEGMGSVAAQAALEWNEALGRTVFVPCAANDARPHITVILLAPEAHPAYAGWTTVERHGEDTHGTIALRVPHMNQLPAYQALGIAVHEFGHVLNVPHEDDDHSVMRGTYVPADWQISDSALSAAERSVN